MDDWEETRVIHLADGAACSYVVNGRGEARIVRCSSSARTVDIPEYIDGHQVTSLGPSSFSGLAGVASMRLPQTVRHVGARAFAGCTSLMAIAFPDALDTFDTGWVEGCARVRDVTFPGSAPEVPSELFTACDVRVLRIGRATGSVKVPSSQPLGLERIEVDAANRRLYVEGPALYDRVNRELVALFGACARFAVPDGVERIGPYAFAWHDELERVSLSRSVTWVGEGAFAHTPSLASVVLPAAMCANAQQAVACVSDRPDKLMGEYDRALGLLDDRVHRAWSMIERLEAPLFLSQDALSSFRRQLAGDLDWLCVDIAERNELGTFDVLVDAGVIDAASFADAVSALSPRRHAEALAYLLNRAHARFDTAETDFAL